MTRNYSRKHFLSGIDVDYYDLYTKRYIWPPGINSTGRRMLFTGPDGKRDHRVTYLGDHRHIGIGTMSTEGTSSLDYLTRPNWKNPPALYARNKETRVTDIGWGIPKYSDKRAPNTGFQKRRGLCWGGAEDNFTHRFQYPWFPKPPDRFQTMRPQTAPPSRSYMKGSVESSSSLSGSSCHAPVPPTASRNSTRHYYGYSNIQSSKQSYY